MLCTGYLWSDYLANILKLLGLMEWSEPMLLPSHHVFVFDRCQYKNAGKQEYHIWQQSMWSNLIHSSTHVGEDLYPVILIQGPQSVKLTLLVCVC